MSLHKKHSVVKSGNISGYCSKVFKKNQFPEINIYTLNFFFPLEWQGSDEKISEFTIIEF